MLSKSLGYKVIAEGVESKEQENYLCEQGCDGAQGYYYARPINAEDFIVLYRKKNSVKALAEE